MGILRSPSVRPTTNLWSRMRITSPSSLPSSHTVSTAIGGRTVGRKRVAEGPLLGVGEAAVFIAAGGLSAWPWPFRPEIA